jgi:hypothetical protein
LQRKASPSRETPTKEALEWDKARDSGDPAALQRFIKRFPDSPLSINAQQRIDLLKKAAQEREEQARAEREAAQGCRGGAASGGRGRGGGARGAEIQRRARGARAAEKAKAAAAEAAAGARGRTHGARRLKWSRSQDRRSRAGRLK